jgi:hypothetical protein
VQGLRGLGSTDDIGPWTGQSQVRTIGGMATPPVPPDQPARGPLTVYGRQGSPTITVALPFSRVQTTDDSQVVAALAEVVQLVERLARASIQPSATARRSELEQVAEAAADLLTRLGPTSPR